jgi:hypothetical protein
MSKIIDAEDILTEARNCVECIFMATADLSATPLQAVADIASMKIDKAIALLDEYRESGDAPVPATAAAKTASRPAAPRTKRSGK